MTHNKTSKKNEQDQLYKILDNGSKKNLTLKNENYLKSLIIRLKSSNKEIYLKPKVTKGLNEEDVDFLKPNVNIHVREKRKIEVIEYKREKPKEKPYEKDLLEIEKVETIEPKFIEVKPKVTTKSKIEKISKKDELPEVELMEWEEVNIKNSKTEKIKDEISEKVTTEHVEFIEKIEDEIIEDLKEEQKPGVTSVFGKIKGRKRKKEIVEFEPVEIEKPENEKEEDIEFKLAEEEVTPIDKKLITEEPSLDFDKKIETYKDYQTINQETAIKLYDQGYTNTETLKNITIKDLTKIKGIKRRSQTTTNHRNSRTRNKRNNRKTKKTKKNQNHNKKTKNQIPRMGTNRNQRNTNNRRKHRRKKQKNRNIQRLPNHKPRNSHKTIRPRIHKHRNTKKHNNKRPNKNKRNKKKKNGQLKTSPKKNIKKRFLKD